MNIERKQLPEMFAAFLQLNFLLHPGSNLTIRWCLEPKLAANVSNVLQQAGTLNERQLAEQWLSEYQQQPRTLARLHLAAYFEESCYRVAREFTHKRHPYSSSWDWFQEYFQSAREIAAEPEKILKSYNSSRSSSLKSVKNFGQQRLASVLADTLGNKCYSDAGLLRRTTKRTLKQALVREGISDRATEYLLAWHSFKTAYVPTTAGGSQALTWPDAPQMEAIAKVYNERSGAPPKNPKEIEAALRFCVTGLRRAHRIEEVELDEFALASEEDEGFSRLLTAAEREEDRENFQQQQAALERAFYQLAAEARLTFELWQGLGFNQGDVAELLDLPRNQIANKCKAWRKQILKHSCQSLDRPLTSAAIAERARALDPWLEAFCQIPYRDCLRAHLDKIGENSFPPEREILKQQLIDFIEQRVDRPLQLNELQQVAIAQFIDTHYPSQRTQF